MASVTETALCALVDKLAALAAAPLPKIPAPLRNEVLPSRIPDFGAPAAKLRAFLNVLDGDSEPTDTALGGGDGGETAYEFVVRPVLEWIVEGGDLDTREAAFDEGLCAIYDALAADRTLGGAASFVEFANLQRSNLNTDGLPQTKAVLVTLEMTLFGARPF